MKIIWRLRRVERIKPFISRFNKSSHFYSIQESRIYKPISKNVVGQNGEWQLSNGNCTTERNCGFHIWYAKTASSSRGAKLGSSSNYDDDRRQKSHKFAYLTMKNSIFARFARAFYIFWHFEDVLVLSMTWNDLFCNCGDDNRTRTTPCWCCARFLSRDNPKRWTITYFKESRRPS